MGAAVEPGDPGPEGAVEPEPVLRREQEVVVVVNHPDGGIASEFRLE